MKLENVQIEKISVLSLQKCLLSSKQLSPYIDENDKTPLWDGNIYVYNSDGIKVKNLIGRVAVQVKGTQKQDLSKHTINYPVKVCNLQKYLDDGGVIYFVVVLRNPDSFTIYYNSLLPFDITRILNSNKKNQKSMVIEMKEFPKDNSNETVNIFMNFLNDKKKQASTVDKNYLSMEDVITKKLDIESFSFGYSGIRLKEESPIQYSLRHPTYIYAKPRGLDIQIPIDVVEFLEARTSINNIITVNNEIYYEKYDVVYLIDSIELHIGSSIVFNINSGKMRFQIKGYLLERIKDINFLIALMNENEIKINGMTLSDIREMDFDVPISAYEDHVEYLIRIKDTLKALGIEEDLNCDILTNDEKNNLDLLTTAILNNEAVSINADAISNTAIVNLKIANLYIKLYFVKYENTLYNIYNYFGKKELEVSFELDGNMYKSSQYVFLKKDELMNLSNINYDRICESIFNVQSINDYYAQVVMLSLEMIKAYDEIEIKKDILLETALKLTNWLIDNDKSSKSILLLNKFQILKRIRSLTEEELQILLDVKQNEKENSIITGACILLESYVEAKMYYEKLDDEIKKQFNEYPIYNLWKR